jgi:hypothetical protein
VHKPVGAHESPVWQSLVRVHADPTPAEDSSLPHAPQRALPQASTTSAARRATNLANAMMGGRVTSEA